jgi:hypothetical protein
MGAKRTRRNKDAAETPATDFVPVIPGQGPPEGIEWERRTYPHLDEEAHQRLYAARPGLIALHTSELTKHIPTRDQYRYIGKWSADRKTFTPAEKGESPKWG